MVAQNKLGRTKRQHDKLIAIKWEVRAPKPKGCCLLPIASRKICCRGRGGGWGWGVWRVSTNNKAMLGIESGLRQGKGKVGEKGKSLFFCDEENSSSVGFQLCTPKLMSHQLNVTFPSKKVKCDLFSSIWKKKKIMYNKENSYKIHQSRGNCIKCQIYF